MKLRARISFPVSRPHDLRYLGLGSLIKFRGSNCHVARGPLALGDRWAALRLRLSSLRRERQHRRYLHGSASGSLRESRPAGERCWSGHGPLLRSRLGRAPGAPRHPYPGSAHELSAFTTVTLAVHLNPTWTLPPISTRAGTNHPIRPPACLVLVPQEAPGNAGSERDMFGKCWVLSPGLEELRHMLAALRSLGVKQRTSSLCLTEQPALDGHSSLLTAHLADLQPPVGFF